MIGRAFLVGQRLFRIFLLLGMVGWAGWPVPSLAEPSVARQQELIHLLRQDCGSCHGLRLLGGLGPPLLPAALNGKSKEYLENVILSGVPGLAMPPWNPFLSPEETGWLVDRLLEGIPE